MIQIPLSATNKCKHAGKFVAFVDECDLELAAMSWHAKIARTGTNSLVYAHTTVLVDGVKRHVKLHRLVWERANGPIPAGFEVDHIDHGEHGGLINTRANLRLASHARNIANGRRRSSNTSGFKGVHLVTRINKWQALIRVDGKRFHLGYFDTAEQAGKAYDSAAVTRFGDFASTNGANRA